MEACIIGFPGDLKQDILSFGDTVEVLEPIGLREDIHNTIENLFNRYAQ